MLLICYLKICLSFTLIFCNYELNNLLYIYILNKITHKNIITLTTNIINNL